MTIDPQQERKKQVLATLTGLLRMSAVAEQVEPKSFMMLLSANYPAICPGNRMDLALLWSSLNSQRPREDLVPLFLKFAEAGDRLGFQVELPAALAQLDEGQRRAYLDAFQRSVGAPPAQNTPSSGSRVGMPAPVARPSSGGEPRPSAPTLGGRLQAIPSASTPPGTASGPPSGLPAPGQPRRSGGVAPIAYSGSVVPLSSENPDEFAPTPNTASAFAAIPDEAQRRMITTLVGAVRATPLGERVSTGQLSYFLASRFKQLFDGERFFFTVVHAALIELEGVDEAQVYIVAARFRKWLARSGVEMVEPPWKLPPEQRTELEKQLTTLPVDTYAPRGESEAPAQPPSESNTPLPSVTGTAEEKREARLRDLGLRGLGLSRPARIAAVLLVGLLGAGTVYLLDPVRSISSGVYDAALPLEAAALVDGRWIGTLDDERWRKLPIRARQEALANLTVTLASEGRLRGARIVRSGLRSTIAFEVKDKLLMADDWLYLGLAKPQKPKPSASPSASPAPTPPR